MVMRRSWSKAHCIAQCNMPRATLEATECHHQATTHSVLPRRLPGWQSTKWQCETHLFEGRFDGHRDAAVRYRAHWPMEETWFHPVWDTNYQKKSHLVQNLHFCRFCIYSYIQKVLCRHDFWIFREQRRVTKKFFTMSRSFVLLSFWKWYFFCDCASSTSLLFCFLFNECPECRAVFG